MVLIGLNNALPNRVGAARQAEIIDTRDLDEDTILDLDRDGHVCAITIEHARERTEISSFSYQQVPA